MKAVLFDFDGVLTTDKTGSSSICNYVSKKAGIHLNTFETVYRRYNKELLYGKLMHRDIWDDVCRDVGYDIPYDYLFESFISTPIDNEMIRLVHVIKNAGLKTGIVTDNKRDRIDVIKAYHGWYSLFDVISISAEIGSGKENEHIFNKTLHLLSVVPQDCIFIDNSEKNLLVPAEMGFTTILYDDEKRSFDLLVNHLKDLGVPL